MRTVIRHPFAYACLCAVLLHAVGCGASAASPGERYAAAIASSRQALDAGRADDAIQTLDATDPDLRSIEFAYLRARAVASRDGESDDLIRSIAGPSDTRFVAAVLSPCAEHVVYLTATGLIVHALTAAALDADDDEPKSLSHDDSPAVWSGAFSHDGTVFASGHGNGDVLVWSTADWSVRHTLKSRSGGARTLAVAPDGSSVVIRGAEALELWSLSTNEPTRVGSLERLYRFGEGLAYCPTGKRVATGGFNHVVLHDASTAVEQARFAHAMYTITLAFSPDGSTVASGTRGSMPREIALFDVETGESRFRVTIPHFSLGMVFTPDGRRIVSTGCDRVVRILDAGSGATLLELPRQQCTALPSISADGRVIGWCEEGVFHFIDLR